MGLSFSHSVYYHSKLSFPSCHSLKYFHKVVYNKFKPWYY
ncbi:hypothetical protein [Escherichia phage 4E10]|nr:hypothetical protein [Escherichia phage 4E10]